MAGLSKTCSCGEPPRPGCRRARQVPQVLNAGKLPDRCIRRSSGRSSRPRSTPGTMRKHLLLKESPGRARDEAILELHSLRSAAKPPPTSSAFHFRTGLARGLCGIMESLEPLFRDRSLTGYHARKSSASSSCAISTPPKMHTSGPALQHSAAGNSC